MKSEPPISCKQLTDQHLESLYYGELSAAAAVAARDHLSTCRLCQDRWMALRSWLEALRQAAPEPSEDLLQRSHRGFRRRLSRHRRFPGEIWWAIGRPWRIWAGAIAAGALLFTLGLVTGRHFATTPDLLGNPAILLDHPELYTTTLQISYDPEREIVSLELLATRRLQVSGSAYDPAVTRLLARSVLASKNPAVRLEAVRLLGELAVEAQDVESAIIAALTTDPNPAVRTQALEAILRRPIMPSARQALIDVLLNDRNLALRLRALEGLAQLLNREEAPLPPQDVSRFLQVAKHSGSSLLRRRTADLLQEIRR